MSKKITIKEEDVEEPYNEIIEQVDNTPTPEPIPEPKPEPTPMPEKQKAECKMRMRELYKCDDCGKYLTKKSLNYSHAKTCKGRPENQRKEPVHQPVQEPVQQSVQQPVQPPVQQPVQPPVQQPVQQNYITIPIHEQMRMERRRAHLDKINRLSMFIAYFFST
jgi:hypothetical protein